MWKPDDLDRRNREVLKDLNSRYLEPPEIPMTAKDYLEGQWAISDRDLEDEGEEINHAENVDKKRLWGQG